jgi:AcrR family transcriptional regulator
VSQTGPSPVDRSAAVKQAILAASRELFAVEGFEATGIRDIAAAAGVNPAIVIRHFGSKERLFVQAVDVSANWTAILDGPIEQLGTRIVRVMFRERRRGGLPIFGSVVRASGRPDIHDHLRRSIEELFARPLIERIPGLDADLRAHLAAAQMVGLMSALAVYDDPGVIDADEDQLVRLYGASLQVLLTGSPA